MRVSDLQSGTIFTLDLERRDRSRFDGQDTIPNVKDEVRLYRSNADSKIILQQSSSSWEVRGAKQQDQTELEKLVDRNLPHLCWVLSTAPEKVTVQIHEFVSKWSIECLEIGIDEKIVEDIRTRHFRSQANSTVNVPVAEILKWLQEKLLITSPFNDEVNKQRLLVRAGQDVTGDLANSFQIWGKEIVIDVKKTDEDRLRIERVTKTRRNNEKNRPLHLMTTNVTFCDFTKTGAMRDSVRTELDTLVRSANSYLKLWQEYNEIEKANILAKAQAFGWIRYESHKVLSDGSYRFYLRSDSREQLISLRELSELALETSENEPNLTSIERERGTPKAFFGQVDRMDLVNLNKLSMDLRPNNPEESVEPPRSGFLFISMQGDRIRLKRRKEAAERIHTASCAMPQLGMILENQSVPISRWRKHKATSQKTLEAFRGNPTSRQKDAIDIAINTPDIALIQGPPGTGKTGTIAALQIRLAEIREKADQTITQTILLTSYQHDAVDNVANRTFVYGLPASRIGGKHRQINPVNDTDRWRRELVEKIEIQLVQMRETPEYNQLRQVQNLVTSYLLTPGDRKQTARTLTKIYDLTQGKIPSELSDRLLAQKQIYIRPASITNDRPELEAAIKAVRSLSTDPISFADGGSQQATKALSRLDALQILEPSDRQLLQTAADWEPDDIDTDVPPFLDQLQELQERLLDRLTPTTVPQAISIITNPEIESLLQQIREALYAHVRQTPQGICDVLEEYLYDLENHPEGVNTMVRRYTAVLAATCQQVAGRQMADITGNPNSIFETVIIDEAARANPLDLFIPMAKAERRIILVGDHRQLPHILEEEVERELTESNTETRDVLKDSLFERLFKQLKAREAQDGIKRTVTLDTQYRMHSILGDFVSRTFYEYHGDPKILTGRPDSDFIHHIPNYEGKVAGWLNVPLVLGSETTGQSKSRQTEATCLAKELRIAMESSKNLTFGVITFYRAQVTEIWNALCEEGVAERSDEGLYQVARQWEEGRADSGKLIERLRVGTVDAFQGKEFDVVFLSMTRSNKIIAKEPKHYRQKYGFLLLENRLCVAMSRQQRLLIVVGDLEMVTCEASKPETERGAMREFINFYQLCQGEHGNIRRVEK